MSIGMDDAVFALAVRLFRGEVLELVDEHGMRWRPHGAARTVPPEGAMATSAARPFASAPAGGVPSEAAA
jgi:hypothetical protein